MYIKHMKLVCTSVKKVVPRAAFLDLGPLRVFGTKEALYYRLCQYRWPLSSGQEKLFRTYQSIRALDKKELCSPCTGCPVKVKCLVTCYSDHDYQWPGSLCENIQKDSRTLPDRFFRDKKVTFNKMIFILEHKCDSCGLNACCYGFSMILRILCPNYIQKEILYAMAEKKIMETWGSVNRFMATLTLGWKEVFWKPPEGKRERKYRIAFIHPNQDLELIQEYYPYRLRTSPVQAKTLGLSVSVEGTYSKEHAMASWVLWKFLQQLNQSRNTRHDSLGRSSVCGHCNFVLSMHADQDGHPVLVSATSKWKYHVNFTSFDDIGYKLGWRPLNVMEHFR